MHLAVLHISHSSIEFFLFCLSFAVGYDETIFIPQFMWHQASGKLLILDQLLVRLHDSGHRVLLFAQMTHTLDILQASFIL